MSKLVLITLIVVGIIVALLIALFVVVYIKTSRAKKISNNEKEVEKKANSLASEVVGTIKKENIKEVSFQGSRVSIIFLNKTWKIKSSVHADEWQDHHHDRFKSGRL